jgi:hypothetical protein
VTLIVDSFEVALVTMIGSGGIELVFVTSIVVGNIAAISLISVVLDIKTMNSVVGQWI